MTLKFTLFPEIFKELLAVSARLAAWREQEIYNSSYWARQEHEVTDNTSAAADRYLAHHPEMQQQMEANAGAAAEQYSVLPYKNFGPAMQLLEEEMVREYGDGQPFIDPGFQAYEAFDYQEPQDNDSSEGEAGRGQEAQAGGTRGREQGEAEANSGMISCLTMSQSCPSPLLSSLWRCLPPTISGTRICVR